MKGRRGSLLAWSLSLTWFFTPSPSPTSSFYTSFLPERTQTIFLLLPKDMIIIFYYPMIIWLHTMARNDMKIYEILYFFKNESSRDSHALHHYRIFMNHINETASLVSFSYAFLQILFSSSRRILGYFVRKFLKITQHFQGYIWPSIIIDRSLWLAFSPGKLGKIKHQYFRPTSIFQLTSCIIEVLVQIKISYHLNLFQIIFDIIYPSKFKPGCNQLIV